MDMTTTMRQAASVAIVDISGRIVLGKESAALRNLVLEMLNGGHTRILFNLAGVNYIDSSGLGLLVSAHTSVRKQGGELKLINLAKAVHDLMQMTKLYTVFEILDDEAVAVKSFDLSSLAGTA
jgi:anti-sigma B factor antagonist